MKTSWRPTAPTAQEVRVRKAAIPNCAAVLAWHRNVNGYVDAVHLVIGPDDDKVTHISGSPVATWRGEWGGWCATPDEMEQLVREQDEAPVQIPTPIEAFIREAKRRGGSAAIPTVCPYPRPLPEYTDAELLATLAAVLGYESTSAALHLKARTWAEKARDEARAALAAEKVRGDASAAALQPFAAMARHVEGMREEERIFGISFVPGEGMAHITAGDLRACQPHTLTHAAAVLQAARNEVRQRGSMGHAIAAEVLAKAVQALDGEK